MSTALPGDFPTITSLSQDSTLSPSKPRQIIQNPDQRCNNVFQNYLEGAEVPQDVSKISFDLSVTEILPCAFAHCSNLNAVRFRCCSDLIFTKMAVELCTSLEVRELSNLSNVYLNGGLQKIGKYAFAGCMSLEMIELPSTVRAIGIGAFCHCTNMSEVILNEGLTKIPNGTFAFCDSLTIIELPSTVLEIGHHAFLQCKGLTHIVLNKRLRVIKARAFEQCLQLRKVVLNIGLQKIMAGAFDRCQDLREVIISEGIERFRPGGEHLRDIVSDAFQHCPNLAVIKFPAISRRLKVLVDACQNVFEPFNLANDQVSVMIKSGQSVFENVPGFELLEWMGEELFGSPECIRSGNWGRTRGCLDGLLTFIGWYEVKEATTLLELALWKINIKKVGAITREERKACRPAPIGPIKESILEYLVLHPSDIDNRQWSMHYRPGDVPGIEYRTTTEQGASVYRHTSVLPRVSLP